ncbi:MAG TPA: hypothetical protein VK140_10970 [Ktedonobacteraceae bacterium]|nr:hypothetical protein [Ktedonobacteraceae bacterium]
MEDADQGTRIACGQGEQEGCPYHGRTSLRRSTVHDRGTLYGYPGGLATHDSTMCVIR